MSARAIGRNDQARKRPWLTVPRIALCAAALAIVGLVVARLAARMGAAAEDTEDRAAILALKGKARARGEKVDWAEFVPDVSSESIAAHQAVLRIGERISQFTNTLWNAEADANEHMAWIFDGMTQWEQLRAFRARLTAAGPWPEEARDIHTALDALLDGPRPTFPVDSDVDAPYALELTHLQTWRLMARVATGRTLAMAARDGGEAAFAEAKRGWPLADFYTNDAMATGMLVRTAIQAILWGSFERICLIDPPSPATLRATADWMDALSSVLPGALEALCFERAAAERFFFLDSALTRPNPSYTQTLAGFCLDNDNGEWSAMQGEVLASVPCLRPLRNLRAIWAYFDEQMNDLTCTPSFPPTGGDQLEAMGKAFKVGWFAAYFMPTGSDEGRPAFFPSMLLGPLDRYMGMTQHSEARKRAGAHALRMLADRLEHGTPYALDRMPVNPVTGQPFKTNTEDGLLRIVIADQYAVRLPLYPGDDGYDPDAPWPFGHAPIPADDDPHRRR